MIAKTLFKRTLPNLPGYQYFCLALRSLAPKNATWIQRIPIPPKMVVEVQSRYGRFHMTRPGRCSIAKSLFWTRGVRAPKRDEIALDLFASLSLNSDIVLDIGSNSGLFSLVAANANPRAEIYCFDILPEAYRILLDNLIFNGLVSRVVPGLVGVGRPGGQYHAPFDEFSSEMPTSMSLALHIAGCRTVEVPIQSLDEICIPRFLGKRVCVKIDVEGTESDIFANGRDTLEKIRPSFLCEFLPDAKDIPLVNQQLRAYNYNQYLITDAGCQRQESVVPNPSCRDWLLLPAELATDPFREFGVR